MATLSGWDKFKIWYAIQPKGLRLILTINGVFFLLWFLILSWIPEVATFINTYFALTPNTSPWLIIQLITYNFIHLNTGLWGLIHVAFNLFWIYWLGKLFEDLYGAHRMVGLYLMGGIVGGVVAVLTSILFSQLPVVPFFDPMPAVLAVIIGVAARFPNMGIPLFILGVIKLRYIALAFFVIELLTRPYHAIAFLASGIFSMLFIRALTSGSDWAAWLKPLFGSNVSFKVKKKPSKGRADSNKNFLEKFEERLAKNKQNSSTDTISKQARTETSVPFAEGVSQQEIDRILDKISEKGYDALTETEKKVLYEASKD